MRVHPEDDVDVSQLSPTAAARAAAGLVVLVGFLTLLSGVQLFLAVRFYATWASLVPWLMVLAGVPVMYVGTQVYRMHGWAALAAAVLMGCTSAGMLAWSLFAGQSGLFSCFTYLVPMLSLTALPLSLKALPDCRRADHARERLRDLGMGLGF